MFPNVPNKAHVCFADGLAAFRAFLKTEFSDENIEFWLACEDYKKIKSPAKLVSKANKIYKEFIDVQAPREACWLNSTTYYFAHIKHTITVPFHLTADEVKNDNIARPCVSCLVMLSHLTVNTFIVYSSL